MWQSVVLYPTVPYPIGNQKPPVTPQNISYDKHTFLLIAPTFRRTCSHKNVLKKLDSGTHFPLVLNISWLEIQDSITWRTQSHISLSVAISTTYRSWGMPSTDLLGFDQLSPVTVWSARRNIQKLPWGLENNHRTDLLVISALWGQNLRTSENT